MKYQTYNFNSFNLYTVKTNKFKNCHLEIVFRSPVSKEKIIPYKFLMELLTFSSAKYPTQKDLAIHLEDLYNATYYGVLSRVGNCLLTNFCLDFINPKYTDNNYLEDILALIIESIFYPNLENNAFDNHSFNIIKNNLLNEIKVAKENPKTYAYKKLFSYMDNKVPLSLDMLGTKEEVLKVTSPNLLKTYHQLLEEDYVDIYVIGDLDMDFIANYLKNNFKARIIKNYDLTLFQGGKVRNKIQIKKESNNISQSHLLVGCNIVGADDFQKNIVVYLYNYILGGGTLDTKLAKYLRQDNSLCYTTNSIYQKYDEAIIIYVGIDKSSYTKALNLIKKALKDMVNKVTKEELENAKKGIITSLNMIEDNPSNIINNYLFQNIASLAKTEKRIEQVQKVTIEDLKKFAKKIKINTVYFLKGEDEA